MPLRPPLRLSFRPPLCPLFPALLLVVGGACASEPLRFDVPPPTVTMRVVVSAEAPILPEPEDDEHPLELLHHGDLVQVVSAAGRLDWAAGGMQRSGELLVVRRTVRDGAAWAFASDLGQEVAVPTAEYDCALMPSPPRCPDRLRRVVIAGGLLSYDACQVAGCGVMFTQDGARHHLALDGLMSVTPMTIGARAVALATIRWVRDPAWTGASLVVLALDESGVQQALVIETEANDARQSPAIQLHGAVTIEGETFVYRGTRREVSLATGEVLASTPVTQRYALPPLPPLPPPSPPQPPAQQQPEGQQPAR